MSEEYFVYSASGPEQDPYIVAVARTKAQIRNAFGMLRHRLGKDVEVPSLERIVRAENVVLAVAREGDNSKAGRIDVPVNSVVRFRVYPNGSNHLRNAEWEEVSRLYLLESFDGTRIVHYLLSEDLRDALKGYDFSAHEQVARAVSERFANLLNPQ